MTIQDPLIYTPHPDFFKNATLRLSVVYPNRDYPHVILNNGFLTLIANGNKYPGSASLPPVNRWGNATIETEYTINPVNNSPVTRECFVLPNNCYWVGSTGLRFRNKNISVGEIGWPPIQPPHPRPYLPDGTPAPLVPTKPPRPDDNPNAQWNSSCDLRCRNVIGNIRIAESLRFTVSYRFVITSYNNQPVNWYYTPAGTSSTITVRESYGPVYCTFGFPTVSFQRELIFPKLAIPNAITRQDSRPVKPPGSIIPFVWNPPTNQFTIRIVNTVNIPAGRTFYFRILPETGKIDATDFKNIPWADRRNLIWKETTQAGNPTITRVIQAAGSSNMTERFKIEIMYYPPETGSGQCTYKYPPIRMVTPTITILPSKKLPIYPTPVPFPPIYIYPPPRPITPWPIRPPGFWNGPVLAPSLPPIYRTYPVRL